MLTSSTFAVLSRTAIRRFQSTVAKSEISKTFLTMPKTRTFQKSWLSDPSTYPVLSALVFACGMAAGVGVTCLMNSPDVRISTEKKRAVIRNWGLP
mmetsp:Transcript_5275/g.10416  ORF Transcript_5275/g.10416 Transcript_5275/m.10416 type:complete len:96 (-) Transcript_5275:134-421(-)